MGKETPAPVRQPCAHVVLSWEPRWSKAPANGGHSHQGELVEPGADACLLGMQRHTNTHRTHRDIHRHTHEEGGCHQRPLAQILPQLQRLCTRPRKEAEVTPFLQEHLMPEPGGASCQQMATKWAAGCIECLACQV